MISGGTKRTLFVLVSCICILLMSISCAAACTSNPCTCTPSCTPTCTPSPSIDIEKSTNGEDADSSPGPAITVGSEVTWEYVVTNTGDTYLWFVRVTDDKFGDDFPEAANWNHFRWCLGPGQSWTFTVTGTAGEGQYENTATVTGLFWNGCSCTCVEDTDPSHYCGNTEIPEFPSIALPMLAVIGLMFVFGRNKRE